MTVIYEVLRPNGQYRDCATLILVTSREERRIVIVRTVHRGAHERERSEDFQSELFGLLPRQKGMQLEYPRPRT